MISVYEPDTKFNKVFMFIGNTITVITGCLAFISWIIQKIPNLPEHWIKFLTFLLHFLVFVFIIGLTCFFVRVICVAVKSKAEAFYIQRKLTEFLHKQLIHKVRNNIVELEPLSLKLQHYSKEGNMEAISERYESEILNLNKNLKYYVDQLSEYLTKYRGVTISICIKAFKKGIEIEMNFYQKRLSRWLDLLIQNIAEIIMKQQSSGRIQILPIYAKGKLCFWIFKFT